MKEAWVGSKLIIKNEEIRAIVKRLWDQTIKSINEADSHIEIHNAYTAYVVMLLFNATGHRPVDDPFCFKLDYDLDLGMMLIDDKAMSEQHRYRLVALPEVATDQLNEYEKHLKWLASHLMDEAISTDLKHAVCHVTNTAISREEHPLPLFFFLKREKNRIKTYSITESALKKYLGDFFWPLPFNFSRHNIATQLRRMSATQQTKGLTTEAIEAHLGHMEGINHPFGASSIISPAAYQHQISQPLQALLTKHGWATLRAKRYYRNLDNLRPTPWEHTSSLLGPLARQKRREDQKSRDRDIIRSALDKYPVEQIVRNPSLLEKIREEIIVQSAIDSERIKRRLLMLWRYLLALKRREPNLKLPRRFHLINKEPSPFSANTFNIYDTARDMRQNFITHLQSEGRRNSADNNRRITYYTRVAEIVISAALFDGITSKYRLEALTRSDMTLRQEGEIIYLDILATGDGKQKRLIWRWLPQPLSIALTSGLESQRLISKRPRKFNIDRFNKELSSLLATIGCGNSRNNSAIYTLSHFAQGYWLMHAPPFLREIANGNLPIQPLPETSLVRLIRGERLKGDLTQSRILTPQQVNKEPPFLVRVRADSHRLKNARQFRSDLSKDIKYAEKQYGKNKKSANYVRKKTLEQRIRARLRPGHHYPSIAVALASWCLKLCSKGTDLFGEITFSTVRDYTNMVADALLNTAYGQYFFHLEADQYDYIYELALEINSHSDQTRFLNNIRDFHTFLVDAGLAPSIDWITFKQKVYENRIIASVDANIITPVEYEQALGILYKYGESGKCNQRNAMLYCALLICGYRFGLRISEALHLQYRNIQHNQDWSFIVVNISNTLFADTKSASGRRQIPLIGNLSPLEKTIIQTVFSPSLPAQDDELSAVFGEESSPRELFDTTSASQTLQAVLKQVTGDSSAHYHLLRHAFNSRIYPLFFDVGESSFSRYIQCVSGAYASTPNDLRLLLTGCFHESSLGLKSLSVASGHSQVSTTFSHYIHTADHHIHDMAGNSSHWHHLAVERVDFITSYAHGKRWDTLSKQRHRKGIQSDDLLGALNVANATMTIRNPEISTTPHPQDEDLVIINTEQSREISLLDIDNVLLLYCSHKRISHSSIAQQLYHQPDCVSLILDAFLKQKQATKYMGYQSNGTLERTSKADCDTEPYAETISLQREMGSISEKISNMNTQSLNSLQLGINAWSKGYYPKTRYRPLVFDGPEDSMQYLDAMRLLGIRSSMLAATIPSGHSAWYRLQERPSKTRRIIALTIKGKLAKRTYIFRNGGISSHIPLPPTKTRYTSNERLSISLDKSAAHPLYVQKRLHRLCFLISIWLTLKSIT